LLREFMMACSSDGQQQQQQQVMLTSCTDYAHIFDLLTKLRQSTNHPYLVVYSASGNKLAPGCALLAADSDANKPSPGAESAPSLRPCAL
jgi:hypothetical protein